LSFSHFSTEAEVDAAYAAAKEAFKIWGRSTPSTRQKALLNPVTGLTKSK
jgi:acyl-CoA reductase-like NAD-dependent aldehyde dehydrogenase